MDVSNGPESGHDLVAILDAQRQVCADTVEKFDMRDNTPVV